MNTGTPAVVGDLLHSQLLATANAQAFNHKHWGVVCHWPKAWRRSATLRRITLT